MPAPKIVIAGGSGFIGRALCRALWDEGRREVYALSRRRIEVPYARVVPWDAARRTLEGSDALINLCGADIAEGRWNEARKRELRESRLGPTKTLVEHLAALKAPPPLFVNASAVGYYGDRGDDSVDESSPPGGDFLARLCADWEAEAQRAPEGVRTVALRLGVVLGPGGGALRRMLLPFRLGLGGPLGSGKQWMSWISRDDVAGLVVHLLGSALRGPVNATAPFPVTNEVFSRELADVLHRPCALPVPAAVARLAFGELADVLLGGQRVLPRQAQADGYAFKHPTISAALQAALQD